MINTYICNFNMNIFVMMTINTTKTLLLFPELAENWHEVLSRFKHLIFTEYFHNTSNTHACNEYHSMEKMDLPPVVLMTVSTIQLPHGALFYESAIICQSLSQISLMSFIRNYQGVNVRRYFKGRYLWAEITYLHISCPGYCRPWCCCGRRGLFP